MKNLFVIILLFITISSWGSDKIKIACIGNSITYGAGIMNREKNSYPAQLQAMLGDGYEVVNFGVSGCTVLSKGDYPYIRTDACRKAMAFAPDVIFIKLGTNDSKAHNRTYLNEFKADYKALIEQLKSLPSRPRIVLLTPLPAFTQPDTVNITASVIERRILPMIEEVAYETGVELIHLFPLFADAPSYVVPDKIHPSSIGAGIIAERIYEYLKTEKQEMDLCRKLNIEGEITNFYGYPCHSFSYKNVPCKVVRPRWCAKGNPWVWRARFWGHEPQTDVALLERGFHVVYCDVAGLFGAPSAVKRWDDFYTWMQKGGMNSKVALEGMSRGGLIVYNWAVKNPEKVACIYADAPVLDLKSWPMGGGIRKASAEDIPDMMSAYGFKDQQAVLNYSKNPVDRAKEIAKAGFPMLHVCGDADDVVPVSENTDAFEKRILENGGNIKVIHKPGVNHHPHSLKNPARIVDFILGATGHKLNFAVVPMQGNEYRSGAGWMEGNGWWENHEEISRLLHSKQVDLLMIGNSITQGLGGDREIVTYKPGQEFFNTALPGIKWESAGISGDRTQHVLFRILNGGYEAAHPKNIILTIGINNLNSGAYTTEETAAGITACADALLKKMPDSHLIVFCTLPAGKDPGDWLRQEVIKVGRSLETMLSDKPLSYIDLYDVFVNKDGTLKDGLYTQDNLHLTPEGYKTWAGEIQKQLK